MKFLIVFGIFIVIFIPLFWLWIRGFDYMDKHHPDYKGNDLFGFDENDKIEPSITPKNAKEMMITKPDDFFGKIDFDEDILFELDDNDKSQIG
jgi:hypothetical protein